MAQPHNEKLEMIDKKMEQLKIQRQAIVNREKEKERKERTHRLIQNGALAEQYLHCDEMPPADFEKILKMLIAKPDVLNLLKIIDDSKTTKV